MSDRSNLKNQIMDNISQQVRIASRRLFIQNYLATLPIWMLVTFGCCFVGLLLPKLIVIPLDIETWNQVWLGGAAAIALLGNGIRTWWRHPSYEQVAMEIDKRFQLRERLSSALLLDESQRATPVGAALLKDAVAKADRIDVRDKFTFQAPASLPWILLPIMACIALLWVPDAVSRESELAAEQSNARLTQVKAQTKTILDEIKKLKNEAAEKGLKEIENDYEKLEKKLEALQKSEKPNESQLLADLNDIKKDIQDRKESLGSPESLKKAFEDLKTDSKGPADPFQKALQEGDFDKAKQELEKLLEKMASKDLTEEEMRALAQQLKELQEAIDKVREDQKALLESLKQEMEAAKQAGDMNKAGQIQQKLEQLEKALRDAERTDAFCEACQNAANSLKQGDAQSAKEALEAMQGELGKMMENAKAAKDLEKMLEGMQSGKKDSKNARSGQQNLEAKQAGSSNQKGKGKGQAEGEEVETNPDAYDSQIRDQMQKGENVLAGKAIGPNRKGISREKAKEIVMAAEADDPNAIENIALPKAQRDQQKEYFESLRK
ncbi:hypothetical protein SH449x_002898 [Pirellulaceae bacterium SH449]